MRGPRGGLLAAVLGVLALAAGPAQARVLKADSILPPGQSGFVSVAGVTEGTGSPHLADQTEPFVNFEYKDFRFNRPGTSESPRAGVTITRDSFGVPRIDASSDRNGWWGVGYAVAQDRLFQIELFRRAGAGRLAEILGSTYLDDDLISRRDYYTAAELDEMLAAIPPELLARVEAYRDGVNAWVDHVLATPADMPGEFPALGVAPTHIDNRDIARIGVLLARTVPSGDGNELANAQAALAIGREGFDHLHPIRTRGRLATIPRSEGGFNSQPGRTPANQRRGLRKSLRFLRRVDTDPAGPGTLSESGEPARSRAERGERPGGDLRRILPSGGSFMWAIRDERRGRAYLFNGPQLGYSIPELFVEFEIHTPVQDIAGVSAAGIPLVGIGHNGRVAWGFTSGLSDEDDLYVEDLTGPETYLFNGAERRMDCRDEVFTWRTPPPDLPGLIDDPGLPSGSESHRICRTVHGPVQHRGDGVAYARRYAIWGRELETVVGLTELNDARNIADADRAMRMVTWNENVIAADSRGRNGYWHPGLHQLKPKRWDGRLPFPGDGRAEWRGLLPRAKRPHVVNPERNWLANWNNVPSRGWTNGDGPARERLSGNLHRVRLLQSLVRRVARNPSYRRSLAIERISGTLAQQRPYVKDRRLRKAQNRFADGIARRTLFHLRRWKGDYHATDGEGTVDPGVAIWEELKDQLEARWLSRYGPEAEELAGGTGTSHEFDVTNGEAIAIRETGPRGYARAARRTGLALRDRFGTVVVNRWREPRRMYDVAAQGAGAAPELPFFDRGTWTQSVALGR